MDNKEEYYKQNPTEKDNIQWVIDIIEENYKSARIGFNIDGMSIYNGRDKNNLGDVKADRDIMICDKCNNCWEIGKTPGEKDYYIYEDFPKIGRKSKKTCPECQE